MRTLSTLEPTSTIEEAITVIERDGGVIIRDFFDRATISELRSDIDAALDAVPWGQDEFSGLRTKRLYGVFQHTRHAATAVRHPHYAGIASHFLERPQKLWVGEDQYELAPNYTVGVSSIVDIHPGEGAQPLHRDDTVWQWRHPEGYRQARVQVMVAVTDLVPPRTAVPWWCPVATGGATTAAPASMRPSPPR